ncbi:MAG: GNAT family N-acetyltransferase [Nitrospiraceae bacterium]|nr:GNAT family N-acetyltransferase [Nitrospiraceae bacterium]
MQRLSRIAALPENFDEFVAEIAEGLGGLYGPEAADYYRTTARSAVLSNILQPAVDTIVVRDQDDVSGILMALTRGRMGQITFIHVLERFAGRGVEDRLIAESIRTLRAAGVDGIVSECVPLCSVDTDAAYTSEGFEPIARAILGAPLNAPGLTPDGSDGSVPLVEEHHRPAASAIVDAYQDHPGRRLHLEVRTEETAAELLANLAAGSFGDYEPSFGRGMWRDGQCVGVLLGCRIMPGCGFVVQVAVRRAWQGQGIGTQLLRDVAGEFRKHGLSRIALGVTWDSPARRLYEKLGFRLLRPIASYVWWRPGFQPASQFDNAGTAP